TACCMVRHLRLILDAFLENPEQQVGSVSLLTETEKQQLVEGNIITAGNQSVRCVHELFSEQATRTPHFQALTFKNESLSYCELDRRSNQLARYLQGAGVGSEVRIALFLERGFEIVIAVLGILKAGGAYVPLDPSY